ncbi:MAG TPA: hypothetical protein VKX33_00435 [Cyclobacteriaceae bacterium]|nr:hypothetical protein [Cyclobacteriaceae bacterium]
MRRFVLVALIIAIVGMVVYLAIFQPQTLKNLWLWIVGFAGLIWSGFRGLFDFLTPNNRSLKEIEADNRGLKNRLEELKTELQEAKHRLANERAENRRQIEHLNASIARQKAMYDMSKLELEKLRSMGYNVYIGQLSAEERKQIEENEWSKVDF